MLPGWGLILSIVGTKKEKCIWLQLFPQKGEARNVILFLVSLSTIHVTGVPMYKVRNIVREFEVAYMVPFEFHRYKVFTFFLLGGSSSLEILQCPKVSRALILHTCHYVLLSNFHLKECSLYFYKSHINISTPSHGSPQLYNIMKLLPELTFHSNFLVLTFKISPHV